MFLQTIKIGGCCSHDAGNVGVDISQLRDPMVNNEGHDKLGGLLVSNGCRANTIVSLRDRVDAWNLLDSRRREVRNDAVLGQHLATLTIERVFRCFVSRCSLPTNERG